MIYKMNEIIKIKKPHVCGNQFFEVVRLGVDLKIRCVKCDRIVMIPKRELDKKVLKKDVQL